MKITGVRTRVYEYELSRALGDANSPGGRTRACELALFIDTDQGLTGVSLGTFAARASIHAFESLLVGMDPRGVRTIWKRMVDRAFKGGNEGGVNDAIGAIDVALWDLKAKANEEPLWQTLGAASPLVKAYASGIDSPLSDEELYEFYAKSAKQGVSAGKLKVGLQRDEDIRRIGVMAEALKTSGQPPQLMIDSNEYWSPKQAIRHIRAYEEQFDIVWVEEPARRWDYRGLKKVSDGVKAAVATGENLNDIGNFLPLIDHGAVDIVQVGIGTSGITGAMQVADLAYAYELPVAMMNCAGNFMGHLAACLPNHMMMEVVDAGRDAVFTHETTIAAGWINMGTRPGTGIQFDEEALSSHEVDQPSPGSGPSPWGRRPGAGLYEVPRSEE